MDTLHGMLRQLVSPFRRVGQKLTADMEAAKQRTDLEKALDGADGSTAPTKEVNNISIYLAIDLCSSVYHTAKVSSYRIQLEPVLCTLKHKYTIRNQANLAVSFSLRRAPESWVAAHFIIHVFTHAHPLHGAVKQLMTFKVLLIIGQGGSEP